MTESKSRSKCVKVGAVVRIKPGRAFETGGQFAVVVEENHPLYMLRIDGKSDRIAADRSDFTASPRA